MKRQTAILLAFILTTLFGCKNDREFSEVKNLSDFENTQFVPTMENKNAHDKNSVYCATLLFAWDDIRKQIHTPLEISDDYPDLRRLNESNSFLNVLKSDEYAVSGEVEGDIVKARAEFSRSLPFEIKLQSFKNKLIFEGQKVSSFGVKGDGSYQQLERIKIIYYKNDDNFILKLLPKDKEHEIILLKTEKKFYSISEMMGEIEARTEMGKREKKNERNHWKYFYAEEDEVVIPKFNFNIETNYPAIEGTKFSSANQNYLIEKAWQRVAFILDESGAKMESKAEMVVAIEDMEDDFENPKPKKMIFDKPFLILLKRTESKNPYFGLWLTNAELMMKE